MPIWRSRHNRDVAQLVSVHVWGACGRQFESGHPDKKERERYFSKCRSLLFSSIHNEHYFYQIISKCSRRPYGRQDDTRAAQQVHEQDKVEKHSARDDCAPFSVQPWFSLSHTCSPFAWHSRCGHCGIAHLHLHQRMFLAWPRGLHDVPHATD